MPTFPNHWAAISGSIEPNETPLESARRELQEETNIYELKHDDDNSNNMIDYNCPGLFIDVDYISPRTQEHRIIRVYPFVLNWKSDDGDDDEDDHDIVSALELKGTEHDKCKFVTVDELEEMEARGDKMVPNLIQTFHHATFGRYHKQIPAEIRNWANDQQNGASIMTANALHLIQDAERSAIVTRAKQIAMLRPTMVPIVNVMNEIIKKQKQPKQDGDTDVISIQSFQQELQRCIDLGIEHVQQFIRSCSNQDSAITILTFSRSGTIVKILKHVMTEEEEKANVESSTNNPTGTKRIKIICSQSTPGNEGELMAKDLNCQWFPDSQINDMVMKMQSSSSSESNDKSDGKIDLILVGSDCILQGDNNSNDDEHLVMINKVGTKRLCEIANKSNIPIYCCADRWKLWDDIFPPSLEKDLFEIVPLKLISKILVPPPIQETQEE